jgi:FAD/FMN-containing dehydrogenase
VAHDLRQVVAQVSVASHRWRELLGADFVFDDPASLELYSQDVYRAGTPPLAVLRPGTVADVQAIVREAAARGIAVYTRGGGMSYTDAYLPERQQSVLIDMSRLDRVRHVAEADLHATVEAGCSWATLDAALAPRGLRSVFWGPMSGRLSTVGGAMSQGAVTFGSGRHGPSGAAALGFEVVLGDGRLLQTGSGGQPGHAPFFRHYGPDLTGLFAADAGAFGIKTAITLQLEPRPSAGDGLSFAFQSFEDLAATLAVVARHGLATEVFGAETALIRWVSGGQSFDQDLKAWMAAGRAQSNPLRALRQMYRIARSGRRFLENSRYSVSFLTEAADPQRLQLALADLRRAVGARGAEIANTMAAVTRAMPFPDPMLLGPEGHRLLPLHGIFPHSDVVGFNAAFDRWHQQRRAELERCDVRVYVVYATCGPSAMLYEPVIYWRDSWPALHRRTMPEAMLQAWREPAPNPAARELVEQLRVELIDLMYQHGAAHLQIGRAYPYARERDPAALALLAAVKAETDPSSLLNPRALGLELPPGVSPHADP